MYSAPNLIPVIQAPLLKTYRNLPPPWNLRQPFKTGKGPIEMLKFKAMWVLLVVFVVLTFQVSRISN